MPSACRTKYFQEQLLLKYCPLVRKIAGGFQRKLPRNILREDLIAAGMSGLWDAIRRNPDGPSESFEWYVRVRVRGAILDELRAQDWLPRRARAAAEAAIGTDAYRPPPAIVRFDDISEWERNHSLGDTSSCEATIVQKNRFESVLREIEGLPDRERFVMARYYVDGVKFEDIASELGVTPSRISQIHARATKRIQESLVRTDELFASPS